ncbi:MAG: DUF2218 domain-containing protein [Solirubrobacteraceae bacterium]|jgi:hypothetical protein
MTPSFAEAVVSTEQGPRHLAELCRTLEERAAAMPDRAVKVEWTETDGTIDFGWARCAVHAAATVLTLRAEAKDESALRQVCDLITRHLEGHAGEEQLTVTWLHDGKPIAGDDTGRRDTMRAFHRRMHNH